jgi:hypothetical protein
MKVTAFDEGHHISHGQVVHHSPSRRAISKRIQQVWEQDPTAHLYVFLGGTKRVTGAQLRELLARAATGDYLNARW